MGGNCALRAGITVKTMSAVGLAVALAGCEFIEKSSSFDSPQLPQPIAGPSTHAQRISGALKPGGGQAVTPRAGRGALGEAEIISGSPRPAIMGRTGQPPVVPAGEPVGLNFVDADLVEVVDVIVGQFLGRNYIIDPAVSGRVTMRTTERIPREHLVGVLENILAMNGAALIIDSTVVRVVPAEAAGGLAGVAGQVLGGGGRGQAVYLIPLQHASAESVKGVAQTVLRPGQEIVVDAKRNYLMFSGTNRQAQAVQDLVDALDVDVMAGRSFGLFPLDVAQADELADELEIILDVSGDDGPVQVMPISRMNAILVIARDGGNLRNVHSWVSRLDRAASSTSGGSQIYVYHVRNGRASELAALLGAVFGGEAAAPRQRTADTGVAPTLASVALGSGEDGTEAAAEQTEERLQRVETGPAQQIFSGSDSSDIAGGEGSAARFIADERNNAIVIVATPTQYELARATLERLDIVPLQVLIEVTIAEVTLNDDLRYGLQWFFESGNFTSNLTNSSEFFFPPAAIPGFNAIFDSGDARVVLSALSELTDVKVISSPQLLVLDNQVARLHVGDQVPVATQSAVSVIDPEAPIVNSIERVDTGVILEVTPRVNSSGLVTLEVVQDVSDAVRTESSDLNSPTIEQRNIQTTVAVQSGETVALGGLIRDRLESTNSGIPVLKDIPVVGSLFGTKGRFGLRTELLVLITPNVLRDPQEARMVTRELRDRLVGLREFEAKRL